MVCKIYLKEKINIKCFKVSLKGQNGSREGGRKRKRIRNSPTNTYFDATYF